jgi:hypothetical protein
LPYALQGAIKKARAFENEGDSVKGFAMGKRIVVTAIWVFISAVAAADVYVTWTFQSSVLEWEANPIAVLLIRWWGPLGVVLYRVGWRICESHVPHTQSAELAGDPALGRGPSLSGHHPDSSLPGPRPFTAGARSSSNRGNCGFGPEVSGHSSMVHERNPPKFGLRCSSCLPCDLHTRRGPPPSAKWRCCKAGSASASM